MKGFFWVIKIKKLPKDSIINSYGISFCIADTFYTLHVPPHGWADGKELWQKILGVVLAFGAITFYQSYNITEPARQVKGE